MPVGRCGLQPMADRVSPTQTNRTTAGYGEWDPDYLTAVADALDAWFVQLQGKVKAKAIFAVPVAASPAVGAQRRA
jgi:hypothetical protein